MIDVALLLGGPSGERGISLNSARSVADHLSGGPVQIKEVIFFDRECRPFAISRGLLYCNTPSDFDFKLAHEGRALTDAELASRLRAVDLAFPVMHGTFGEDGQVQSLLEQAGVPFVGTGAAECAVAFDKFSAMQALTDLGIAMVPSVLVDADTSDVDSERLVETCFPDAESLVLKPAMSGSSIDVFIAPDRPTAVAVMRDMRTRHARIVVQPQMTGAEVTTVVLEGPAGPVALIPIEIQLNNRVGDHEIFDYRRKYLPSNDTHYHCPPQRDDATVATIQQATERVFAGLGLRDFARVDGWLLSDGSFVVSDINPISGMEQNSFLFIQAAQLGMTHADVLQQIIRCAASRIGIEWPSAPVSPVADGAAREAVAVLFGGDTAERQVSVMSGTNVWLKLTHSAKYRPVPYLLDPDGSVWQLPYSAALRHSVEEIVVACHDAQLLDARRSRLAADIVRRLELPPDALSATVEPPVRLTMDEFLDRNNLVFIALHGGDGENGTLQERLDKRGIRYNGSGPAASRVCMDKYETGLIVAGLSDFGIYTARRAKIESPTAVDDATAQSLWSEITGACANNRVVVKPLDDGCSAGILPLAGAGDLRRYLELINSGEARLNGAEFSLLTAEQLIEMPTSRPRYLLFEDYIETDDISVAYSASSAAELVWGRSRDTGWIEVTVGVIGPESAMVAMNPSITVASAGILSLEEKFMGGTGVNITPPPGPPFGRVQPGAVDAARDRIARTANALGMRGYGRIDAFMHRETGEIIVIEANSLPGLTPATVFYHQALAEDQPMTPKEVLERILDLASVF